MPRHDASLIWFGLGIVFFVLVSVLTLTAAFAASAPGESIDQLYEKAKKDGKLILYAPLSARSMEVILPGFMKRFPGVTVNHIDSTPNQLLARVLSEARGGRVLADVFGGSLPYMAQISEQKLIAPLTVPEAAAYPAQMKSDFWVATDTQYYIAGWNTNLVKKGDEPKSYEDFTNSKWKSNLIGEDRDYQMLAAFAKRKYNSDEKAMDLFKRIAANKSSFTAGIQTWWSFW